ncbi:hypothetical protein PR202_ga08572 [Eleusine coracana subsp. coracana]|uniref:RRM domain-containing protein n=1 Tax=Eleusine coracana subsp. coracana TaxID=191504 RepID=A0AAV5C2W4_ELECO|nr:hypothetical protein QOZ80_1BG0093730 [Eleusine coracana subsp. coracana]GJM92138.1 hypothetical protein PR202_ga08572 [Eleusine coracana subsp. coracana]
MEGGGGGSGMGGISGGPGNLLDAGAQAFYPAVGAPYPVPLQPVPHQLYYTHPCPPAIPPPPLPPPMAMSVPMPMAPQTTPGGYSLPASDGPSSHAVVLGLVPPHAQESDVARAMAVFGAIRSVDASAVASEGSATVHFFDIRAAELAVACVRDQHMRQQSRLGHLYAAAAAAAAAAWTPPPQPTWVDCWQNDDTRGLVLGQAVWAHFAPDIEAGDNRGSLVVLTALPAGVTLADLRKVFQAFGELKDVRESAQRTSHKFVDFFDTRDAARALAELNGRELFGRRLVIEFTRPSLGPGARRLHNRPIAPPPPRHQAAWRPSSQAASLSQPVVTSSSSSTSGKAREGVVLLRRSSARVSNVGDQSNKGRNAGGTSHERKCKGGGGAKNIMATAPSASSSTASASGKQSQSQTKVATTTSSSTGGGSNWKGRRSGWEARFLFKDPEAAGDATETPEPETEKDTRTTVMIRNIPNKYSQKLLLNMLDNHCIQSNERIAASGEEAEAQPFSAYDFVYLPIDFNNKCNVGYGFVNLTSPEAAVRLYKAFHRQPWEVYNSRKICQVTYARVQGLEALKEHFKNSKFPCESDEYLPVSFSPPRDGKQLTEPVPIVGRSPAPSSASMSVDPLTQELMPPPSSSGDGASSTTASTHAPSDRADDEIPADDYDGDEEAEERLLVGELRQLGYTD